MSKEYTAPRTGKLSDQEIGKSMTLPRIGKVTLFPVVGGGGGLPIPVAMKNYRTMRAT